jgi:hypothetical protein
MHARSTLPKRKHARRYNMTMGHSSKARPPVYPRGGVVGGASVGYAPASCTAACTCSPAAASCTAACTCKYCLYWRRGWNTPHCLGGGVWGVGTVVDQENSRAGLQCTVGLPHVLLLTAPSTHVVHTCESCRRFESATATYCYMPCSPLYCGSGAARQHTARHAARHKASPVVLY